jgi:hypothetical protein
MVIDVLRGDSRRPVRLVARSERHHDRIRD